MSRIRTIKPSFFKSDDVSALPLRARLTWIGLWTQCDDQGRTKDHTRLIKADIWPLDPVSIGDIEEDLSTLAAHGRIVRYQVNGQRYLEVVNWSEHQKIDRPSKSRIPPPPNGSTPATGPGRRSVRGGLAPTGKVLSDGSPESRETTDLSTLSTTRALAEASTSARAGKGREGKGREGSARAGEAEPAGASPEPPQRCPEHENDRRPPPCGNCADARRIHDAWETERTRRLDAAPRCAKHRYELADNCRLCAGERKAAS